MLVGDHVWNLTKHGRRRFLERVVGDVDNQISDTDMLKLAVSGVPGFVFLWGFSSPRYNGEFARRLITVVYHPHDAFYLSPRKGGDLIT